MNSDLPVSSIDMLQVIRRDLLLTLVPELQSAHARTLAAMMDTVLRHLVIREQQLAPLLNKLASEHEELLPQLKGAATAAQMRSGPPEWRALWRRESTLAEAMEPELIRRVRADVAGKPKYSPLTDPVCVSAIAAEQAYLRAAVEQEAALPLPTYSAEESAALAVTSEKLEPYFERSLPGRSAVKVLRIQRVLGGFSKETYLIDLQSSAGSESVALRRDNPYGPVDSTVVDEFGLLRSLHTGGMPVSEPLIVETDTSVLGYPFLVSCKVPGSALPHTVGVTVGPEHIRTVEVLAEVLARLHTLDVSALNLPRAYYDPTLSVAQSLHRDIDQLEAIWRKHKDRPSVTLACAFEWLLNVPPDDGPMSLIHGDAGPHNLLMHEGRASAMLDWEFAHVGDPTEDLTYCRLWTDQVMPFDEFLRHYYMHGGREYRQEKAAFYSKFSNIRHVITSLRAFRCVAAAPSPNTSALMAELKYGRYFQSQVAAEITA